MTHLLTTRHGPHDSDMLGQAAAGQWSSHTVDNYRWATRGLLHLMMVHAAVQWFASSRCVCRSQDGPRTARVVALAASGWFCVSLEPHGLNVGGPRHQIWTVEVL